jgi:ribosome recycling factor
MYNFGQFKNDLKKVEEWLLKEYFQIHTGRASPAVLDSIMISSYGSMIPIKNVAAISIEDPKTLRVSPWDKGQIKDIEKGIQTSGLPLSVLTDGEGLRVIFPLLTEESRVNLVKLLKVKLEDARISARKEREKVWNDIQVKEKEGKMSEDDKFRAKNDLQKIVDAANNSLEEIFYKKEKEVMG